VPGFCNMVGSSFHDSSIKLSQKERAEKIEIIQTALENKLVQAKLQAYNLNGKEIKDKLQNCSDAQIHMLAQASANVLAGGEYISNTTLLILILIILLVVILVAA